jgi:hypothetical protein
LSTIPEGFLFSTDIWMFSASPAIRRQGTRV